MAGFTLRHFSPVEFRCKCGCGAGMEKMDADLLHLLDEARFEQKMNQMGVSTYWEVFQSAFYPYLKSEIKKSWERIFDIDNTEQTNLGAAVWQLRQEDVVGINSHSASEERDGFSGK